MRWAVQVFFISVVLSAVLTLASEEALDGAGLPIAFAVLAAFILLGIVFDIIGVAVTAADERPFHSMAAQNTPGAREALEGVRPQLSREALEARLKRELANLSGPRPFGRAEVLPLGVLLHIAPGNMPGLPAVTAAVTSLLD